MIEQNWCFADQVLGLLRGDVEAPRNIPEEVLLALRRIVGNPEK
jgi:hypothetical protein